MRTSNNRRFKNVLIGIVVFVLILTGFIYLNITFSYPLNDVREKLIEYKEINGQYPDSLDTLGDINNVKFMFRISKTNNFINISLH